jgi:hypothetical protein
MSGTKYLRQSVSGFQEKLKKKGKWEQKLNENDKKNGDEMWKQGKSSNNGKIDPKI